MNRITTHVLNTVAGRLAAEILEAVEQQRRITRLRLDKLLNE
jgi:hypothetical protein